MKHHTFLRAALCMMAATGLFAACSVTDYESGDGSLSYMRADYADITVQERKVTQILTDGGESLVSHRALAVSDKLPEDTVLRRLIYYNMVEGTSGIDLLKTVPVEVLKPHLPEETEEMKTDPVVLESAWKAANDGYVNLRLGLKTAGSGPEGARQLLMMRLDRVSDKGAGRTFLSLGHDQAGVSQYYTEEVHLSVPMPETDTLTLKINTYSGVVERTFYRKAQ